MNSKKVIQILEKAKVKGALIPFDLESLPEYTKYKKEKFIEKRVKYGIKLVQVLINASNLDKAEKILKEVGNISNDEVYMGAIWEKRGWIADNRNDWNNEIDYFKKARKIYETIPGSKEIEGYSIDRILTVEHFIARALYFRGRKSDLKECEEIFNRNLEGYKKLKHFDAAAFNYSWLVRTYIAMGNLNKADANLSLAKKYFDKASITKEDSLKSHTLRIMSEFATAKGEKEKAVEYAIDSLRYVLPSGTYYNGVIEAVKQIIEASS